MVTSEAKLVLTHTNIDPKKVADAWGINENECWDYISQLNAVLREEEKNYMPPNVQEWVPTIPDNKNIRIEVLKERLMDAKNNPDKYNVPKLLWEVRALQGKVIEITDIEIQRAKEYPIENLLKEPPRRGVALCPLHNEKTPSFNIKNNRFNCFGCNAHGDSIDLCMAIHNITFIEAVKKLQ